MVIKKFKPLNKRVLVKLLEKESKTESGIYLPDDAKTESKIGKVIAVDTNNKDNVVKIGDTVMFSEFSANKLEIEGTEHVVLQETDLLGILE